MDDKTLEFLEKILSEVQDVKGDVKDLKGTVKSIDNRLIKLEMSMENDIKPKINMCIEEITNIKEKQFEHDGRFDSIERKFHFINVINR